MFPFFNLVSHIILIFYKFNNFTELTNSTPQPAFTLLRTGRHRPFQVRAYNSILQYFTPSQTPSKFISRTGHCANLTGVSIQNFNNSIPLQFILPKHLQGSSLAQAITQTLQEAGH